LKVLGGAECASALGAAGMAVACVRACVRACVLNIWNTFDVESHAREVVTLRDPRWLLLLGVKFSKDWSKSFAG